jgi:urease accessory protein
VTRIGIRATPGRARLDLTQGPISPRVLQVTDSGARIGLVATVALLLGDDHLEIDISVGPGARLEIVETAGTVAYDAGGVASSWTVRAQLAERAVLIWLGEPFVVAQGANVRRSTSIELADGAVACLRETLVLGRTGETGGNVRSRMSVDVDGAPLLVEDLQLGVDRALPGVIGAARVVDSLALLGTRAPAGPEMLTGNRFELDGPGTIARHLGMSAASSPIGPISAAWGSAVWDRAVSAATTS